MTKELKSCPFCGGNGSYSNAGFGFIVKCKKCGSKTSIQESGKEAAEAWNSRSIENELSEKIEKLERKNRIFYLNLIEIAIGINVKGRTYTCAELRKIAREAIEEADEKQTTQSHPTDTHK